MTKRDQYRRIGKRLASQLANESDWLANLANSAQLMGLLIDDINWLGFYLQRDDQLILGPFWGNPAVTRIAIGSGVCGTAAERGEAVIVPNVHEFPGHIVCDVVSNSEIVIPLFSEGRLIGVLDIDSPTLGRFDADDLTGLQAQWKIIESATNFNDFWRLSL